jgi:phosphohistidine phosphatase
LQHTGKQANPLRNLYLLRHAKSSWDDPRLDDFDRPLSLRGTKACKLMKAYIRKALIEPDLILCSSARRAQETYIGIADAFARETEVRFEYGLYETDSRLLLKRLRQVDRKVSCVMMIGHNTGLEHLALALTSGTETKSLARMREKFPTLGLACIEIRKGAWSAAGPGCARLSDFVIPRDLEGDNRKK